MIHVDTKQLVRFEQVVHRILKPASGTQRHGAGYETALVALDDATRSACVEVFLDDRQSTTVSYLLPSVCLFDGQGITCKRVG